MSHLAHDTTTAFNSLLSPYEQERADILSRYYAWAVANLQRGVVRRFRDMMLEGTVLSWNQARALLDSPAPWFLSHEQFKALGVPLIGHSSRIVAQRWKPEKSTAKVYEVTLYIEWSGGTRIESIRLEWQPPELWYKQDSLSDKNTIEWLQSLVGPFQSDIDIEKTRQFQFQPFQAEIIRRCNDDFGITQPLNWSTHKVVSVNQDNETLYYYGQRGLT